MSPNDETLEGRGGAVLIGIIIITHADLGKELLEAAELIMGKQEYVVTLGLHAEDAIEELPNRIRTALSLLDGAKGIVALVDLFGGSPAHATLRVLAQQGFECVSGVNLPMLLEVLTVRENLPPRELADIALMAGRQGVQDLGERFREQA
jgi:mannose PTS system EIIA component